MYQTLSIKKRNTSSSTFITELIFMNNYNSKREENLQATFSDHNTRKSRNYK